MKFSNSVIFILFLYYGLFVELYSLYTIFKGLVGRTTNKLKSTENSRVFQTDGFTNINKTGVWNDLNQESNIKIKNQPSNFYLIVIDALRPDFISMEDTPFIWSALTSTKSVGKAFKVRVKSPTVTLPRIKSIVTGSIPSYQDFLTNFHSTLIEQDNIIWRFKKSGKNICFYGDDTWLKLFDAKQYFTRFEGVNSFFVTDWVEVDNNVTRNVNRELNLKLKPACQVTILHYLGLDHIGHVHGPKSSLIHGKLKEMDKIVQKIVTSVPRNSLVFICGDHGMANVGGHGGDSWEETHTLLIALKDNTSGMAEVNNAELELLLIQQTDIAPTIAILFGMETPSFSIGNIIPDILSLYMSSFEILSSYHRNVLHLMDTMFEVGLSNNIQDHFLEQLKTISSFKMESQNQENVQILRLKYEILSEELSNSLADQLAGERDVYKLGISVVLITEVFIISLMFENLLDPLCLDVVVSLKKLLLYVLIIVFLTAVFSFDVSLLVVSGYIIYNLNKLCVWKSLVKWHMEFLPPLLIYFGSSLIEEEHYVRYYLFTTIVSSVFIIFPITNKQSSSLKLLFIKVCFLLLIHRSTSVLNQTGQKWVETEDLNDFIVESKAVELLSLMCMMLLIYLRRGSSFLFQLSVWYIYIVKVFLLWSSSSPNSALVSAAQFGYLLTLATFSWEFYSSSKNTDSIFNTFLLLNLMLHKLINYTVLLGVLVQLHLINDILSLLCFQNEKSEKQKKVKLSNYCSTVWIWFSYACFFYQGNSNSIATIDVNSGYMGLESYNSIVIGSLIFFYTSSCPLIVYSFILFNVCNKQFLFQSHLMKTMVKVNTIESLVYSISIVMFRNHLFIWSVFVPKLLYLMCWTVFHIGIVSLYCISKLSYRITGNDLQ